MESPRSVETLDNASLKAFYETSFLLRLSGGICIINLFLATLISVTVIEIWMENSVSELPAGFFLMPGLAPMLALGVYCFYARPNWGREYGLVLCLAASAVVGIKILLLTIPLALTLFRGKYHFGPHRLRFSDLAKEIKRRKYAGTEHH